MGERVRLSLAMASYDRIVPLLDGRVVPHGISLVFLPQVVEETFWRMARFLEYDVAEFSFSSYLIARDRGLPLTAIPVFPSRMFRHSAIYVHTDSGIQSPQDLVGKRIGVPEYQLTACVWVRGMLQDEYGVRPEEVVWYVGGEERSGRQEKLPLELPPTIRLQPLPPGKTLNAMLEDGEIDALIAPRAPSSFLEGSPNVRRLFENWPAVEAAYYRRTGIFPIMHVVVIRDDVLARDPWVARNLFVAFEQARRLAWQDLHQSQVVSVMLPWLHEALATTKTLLGEDYWTYGVAANRHVIETLVRYAHEQGLIRRRFAVEELFAPSTLEEFVI